MFAALCSSAAAARLSLDFVLRWGRLNLDERLKSSLDLSEQEDLDLSLELTLTDGEMLCSALSNGDSGTYKSSKLSELVELLVSELLTSILRFSLSLEEMLGSMLWRLEFGSSSLAKFNSCVAIASLISCIVMLPS